LLGPGVVEYLKTNRSSGAWSLVGVAEADDVSGAAVDEALAEATDPQDAGQRTFDGFHGLKRIHEAEASLEDVASAGSNPQADTFQENEKNFLGEITVNAGSGKKK